MLLIAFSLGLEPRPLGSLPQASSHSTTRRYVCGKPSYRILYIGKGLINTRQEKVYEYKIAKPNFLKFDFYKL